jgi:septal ring factor EnvC (AmiA/AmiB activator)
MAYGRKLRGAILTAAILVPLAAGVGGEAIENAMAAGQAQAQTAAPAEPQIGQAIQAGEGHKSQWAADEQKTKRSPAPSRIRRHRQKSNDPKLNMEQARELYRRRQRRLEQIKREQKRLATGNRRLAQDRARMRSRLIDTAKAMKNSERLMGETEEKLGKARKEVSERKAKLQDRSAEMSALFALMQRMSRNPPPVMITRSSDAFKMIRSGMVLANFYADVEKRAAEISAEISSLDAAVDETEAQDRKHRAEQTEYARLKSRIDLLLIENQERLRSNKERLEALQSAAKIHAAALKDLKDIVPKLDEEVSKNSALGEYEEELKSGSTQLSPDARKVALSQPGRMKPSIPFAQAKGLLPLPAAGTMEVKFGQDHDGVDSKGLQIATRPGAQVTAPCDGWIVYAGQFRNYGQLLIINAGGGYHILLAGMERIQAEVGQFILAGEPVAAMGGVQQARAGDNKPAVHPTLYVEFRREQQPIDPAPWWSVGGGKG